MSDNPGVVARSFSTDACPETARLDAWRAFMDSSVGELEASPLEGRPFSAASTFFGLPDIGVIFARRSDSDTRFRRSASDLREGPETFSLTVVSSGRFNVVQDGSEACVGPNGGVVLSSPALIHVRDGWEAVLCHLPVGRTCEALPGFDPRRPVAIPAENAALRTLALYLDAVRAGPQTLSGELAESMSDHIFDLSILALGVRGDAREAASRRGWLAAKSLEVHREIDARTADPRLSLATIGDRLGLPEPDVRALFDMTGDVFAERLEARRLDLAKRRLRCRDWDHLSIAEIAILCGFSDVPRFRRRFRARFGDTPGAVRTRLYN